MESEPIRDRASLLTSARLRPWRSSRPLSAVEDEAARVRSPSGKRVAPCEWVSSTPSSTMERQPDRRRDLPRKQLSFGLASSTLALSASGMRNPTWRRNPA